MGCHVLLQGIFPTQGMNLGLPHCRQILYRLSHKEDFVGGKEGSLLRLKGLGAPSSQAPSPTLAPKSVGTGNQLGPCTKESPRPPGRCDMTTSGLRLWSRLLPRAEVLGEDSRPGDCLGLGWGCCCRVLPPDFHPLHPVTAAFQLGPRETLGVRLEGRRGPRG